MFLERLEISGFKSFAKRTTFLFPDPRQEGGGITAVVGPNGSGKSCLLDSIRWVLGEQSLKVLRGKKSEDVIFSGSAERPAARTAEVTLVLNNEQPPLQASAASAATPEIEHLLQGSSIAITRVVDRSGTSEYLLNGVRARLADLTMLLARIGLGTNTYSLIGQGMIDALLLSSPKEWKEFFDDATGITPYRLKREATLRKIESTKSNLVQAEALKTELEPQVRSLSRQMKRFERRQEYTGSLADAELRYYTGVLGQLLRECAASERAAQDGEHALMMADAKRLELEQEFERLAKARGGQELEQLHEQMMELMRARGKLLTGTTRSRNQESGIRNQGVSEADGEDLRLALERIATELESLTSLEGAKAIAARLRILAVQLKTHTPEAKLVDAEAKLPVGSLASDPSRSLASDELTHIDSELAKLESEMRELRHKSQQEQQTLLEAQRALTRQNEARAAAGSALERVRVELARLEIRRESLERELASDVAPATQEKIRKLLERGQPLMALSDVEQEELRKSIQNYRHQLELIGGIDEEVVSEYHRTSERFTFLQSQIADVSQALSSLSALLTELEKTMEEQFFTQFGEIQKTFSQTFVRLFGGGKARIVLVQEESLPPGSESEITSYQLPVTSPSDHYGITIEAQPPGKKVKNLTMLSGGEKALTAIALVAALIAVSPTPFVVLDEVDAALDEGNSARLAEIIAELAQRTQFVVITHNRSTMHKAKMLYGITMGEDGASQALSVTLERAEAMAPTDMGHSN